MGESPVAQDLLVHAKAADACARLPSHVGFDLVYLDPPYGAGGTRTARTRPGEARSRDRSRGASAYEDVMPVAALVAMLESTLVAIRGRMTEHATVVLHMDHRAVHEAKAACDRVFGGGAFIGEVIWVPGNGARGRGLSITHQTLLFYARGRAETKLVRWNADDPLLREPFADTSLSMHFKSRDADGRLYRERTIAGKSYRYYADVGRRLGSVWTDIPAMTANTPLMREGTGYPTQKPLRLLERIVVATTTPGETVADLMCGSGTTLVAGSRHARRFVGADASALAIATTEKRLTDLGIPYTRAG